MVDDLRGLALFWLLCKLILPGYGLLNGNDYNLPWLLA